ESKGAAEMSDVPRHSFDRGNPVRSPNSRAWEFKRLTPSVARLFREPPPSIGRPILAARRAGMYALDSRFRGNDGGFTEMTGIFMGMTGFSFAFRFLLFAAPAVIKVFRSCFSLGPSCPSWLMTFLFAFLRVLRGQTNLPR
ncbi:MAG: hypothetical protein LBI87_06245, partial [Candidatus Accumulibacter sp.]|nr:hypothetical protein [Accumulibacter sp.]